MLILAFVVLLGATLNLQRPTLGLSLLWTIGHSILFERLRACWCVVLSFMQWLCRVNMTALGNPISSLVCIISISSFDSRGEPRFKLRA